MNNDQLSSAIWVIVGLLICMGSFQYKLGTPSSPGAGFAPFLTGAGIALFSAIGFLHALSKRRRGEGWAPILKGVPWKNSLVVFMSLSAYALILPLLGFFFSTFFFMAFSFRVIFPYRWHSVIGGAILTAFASYIIFEVLLKAQLPKGFLGI